MIKVYNRCKKDYEVELVAGNKFLEVLYNSFPGKLGLEVLVKRKIYSAISGIFCDSTVSKGLIKKFISNYKIDTSECIDNIYSYGSFNEFFYRKLKSEARPFNQDKNKLLSPGDGRLSVWYGISIDKLVQVKGMEYKLKELVQDDKLAQKYEGGVLAILRLCPLDYHRFHFIDNGICSSSQKIKGSYYSVNPVALKTVPYLYCRNKREYSVLKSENFGDVLYIEVGATSVGSIIQTYSKDSAVLRGEEKGYFKFGGSTLIMMFEKNKVVIDEEILTQTLAGFETKVLAGEEIGQKLI